MIKQLPNNWKMVKVKNVVRNDICLFNRAKYHEEFIRYIDISSIDNINKVVIETTSIAKRSAPSRAKYILQENDIIISTVRPNLNAVAMISKDFVGCVASSGFSVVRLIEGYSPQYFFLYFVSPLFIDMVNDLIQGAMYPAISNNDVKNAVIPVPICYDEQEELARCLYDKIKISQKIRIEVYKQKEAVDALQTSILQEVFPFKEGDKLPNGWKWNKLSKLASNIQYGLTIASTSKPTNWKLLRITDIQRGNVNWSSVPYCDSDDEEAQKYELRDCDIVFARTGATTGKSFLVRNPQNSVFASYLIRVQCNGAINPDFLYLFFNSSLYWKYINKGSRGGTLAGFNATMLGNISVPYPVDKNIQQEIVKRIMGKVKNILDVSNRIDEQVEVVEILPSAILREEFTFN